MVAHPTEDVILHIAGIWLTYAQRDRYWRFVYLVVTKSAL